MKLISFLNQGVPSYGVVNGDDVLDLSPFLGAQAPDLKTLIAKNLFGAAADAAKAHKPTLKFSQLQLLPVIPNPGQIFCIGLNYGEHVLETGREVTEVPTIFIRLADSQVALIIGKGGRRIQEEDAWDHIAGYSCYNDGSVRDWQIATSQWTPGKNFYKTGGFGPWMVTSDEIAPAQVMRLQTVLNGQVLQDTTTDKMIHSIPRQIAYISTFIPLSPGDVIVTGTPGGVGNKRTPQIFMKPGDVCEIVVDAIGTLRNGIRDDA